jgi:hypothetical protein
VTTACGQIVDAAEGEDVGHVAGRGIAFEVGPEGVGGDKGARIGRGEDCGGEDGAGVVDEFGVGIGEEQIDAVSEALLDFGFEAVVVGGSGEVGHW